MAEQIDLEIATPERLLVKEQVSEVQIPGKEGYLGILPGHAPLLGLLGTGTLSYAAGGRKRFLSIHGGFVEVLPGQVRVLANIAERGEEINIERARQDLQTAHEQVMNPALGVDPAAALDSLAAAQARIEAAENEKK
ncbi:MAG TPA: ATP synthase F1 subunit epsilon [Candidatus Sulfopaludibacter sp.]|jgi:F-type H+-transporting ATPase subunit epsilon|nr:ATP synthase F1 subunit epsilon [Candidatus Sulfopaludibacter sp.]